MWAVFSLTLLLLISPQRILAQTQVQINEFLAHPSSGNKEWVEFYNPDEQDLTSYWLDDDLDFSSDSGSSAKKSLTGINTANVTFPYLEFNSFFNNDGDYVVLFSQDGTVVDQFQYTEDPGEDISFGRYPDGNQGSQIALDSQTPGAPNSAPPNPTPTPDPTSSPNPTPNPTPSPKPPTPTPKSSPKPTPIASKSPLPSAQDTEAILGVQNDLGESTNESTNKTSEKSPESKPSKVKVAGILIGAGLVLIGLSLGFYLWYSKVLGKTQDQDKNQDFDNQV